MSFRVNLNFRTVAIIVVCILVIWMFSTCGCTHGGMYGLYEGVESMAKGKDSTVVVNTGTPVTADKKSTADDKKESKPTTAIKPTEPAPVTPPTTDKKGNAPISATASPAKSKDGFTNLMGYNSNNSTVNWGYPAPVSNYVPPSESNPLSYGELNMFANTPFKPECCPSTYSNSMGCACMNKDQYNYLISRGGNNVPFAII